MRHDRALEFEFFRLLAGDKGIGFLSLLEPWDQFLGVHPAAPKSGCASFFGRRQYPEWYVQGRGCLASGIIVFHPLPGCDRCLFHDFIKFAEGTIAIPAFLAPQIDSLPGG